MILIRSKLRVFIPEQTILSFLIPFVYLLFSSNPFWGIHYETSERTTNFINAIIFLLVSFFLVIPNGYLLGVVVFLMFLSAVFFKVTQLVEYFGIWLFMIYTWKMIYLPVSMIGAAVALAIFYFFLKSKGLWVRENLGIFGYISLNYKKSSDTIKDIERKIEILLVEDNEADQDLMREAFEESQIKNTLYTVRNGEEAIQFLRKQAPFTDALRPDIILLDLNLPKKDGREVLSEIKADLGLKSIPVIVLTTSNSQDDINRCYKLHANCNIRKPVEYDKFVTVVKGVGDFWFHLVALPVSGEHK